MGISVLNLLNTKKKRENFCWWEGEDLGYRNNYSDLESDDNDEIITPGGDSGNQDSGNQDSGNQDESRTTGIVFKSNKW